MNVSKFLKSLEGWRTLLLLIPVGFLATAVGTVTLLRQADTNEFLRGELVARQMGCFACHGAQGTAGTPNPGSALGEVPAFHLGGSIRFYVYSDEEIAEWILYGAPQRLWKDGRKPRHGDAAASEPPQPETLEGLIRMPAYEGLLSEQELGDLVTFVRAVGELERPRSREIEKGRRLASQQGCFGCHGPDGRGGASNPGSFKGYIPPWDGEDFAELVRTDAELRQWILDGKIERFEANPLASYFTHSQIIQMPAYRGVLGNDELEAIVRYIHWLREEPRVVGEHWVETEPPPLASRVERGEWLYREAGCITCHGFAGRGDVPNPNAAGEAVPVLNDLAEKMELFEQEDVDAIVQALEQGRKLEDLVDAPPVARFEAVLSEYRNHFDVILGGAHPRKRRRDGPEPPMKMPAWQQRRHADGGPTSRAEIDAIIAYLLTLQSFEEEGY